ncbi:Calcium/calmodulin-dependent/calcium-dependent protein kinase [Penicillium bovifimosum]|uniref:Calcium/calmodulin-dependent/calcium-dependent protein kinase n=1 Tax=Penicillium bovifimosum TaxID=126998 RepID=A0A9W9GUV4_9EURO|nr:Calcium/calmodulin-dependent/calcium-dependent protein kinase [Penicillium bovifimosum]KAJ5130336.1 Calcium/calmodulin-dependent/calcium-dependent protein kinase [Penicillium bovifimosum]
MSTIQNIKNFIRHGKQARLVTPHSEPTTDVSTINAEPQRQPPGQYTPGLEAFGPEGRANAIHKPDSQVRHDRSVEIERLVAEENMNRSKMPKYPGLERWILVEKMGDGAFSNVYRAKDTTTEYGEVAIKVVRKFEMNSNQRANILKEVQIMRNLDHPNIVKLIDFSESRQYYYIVLELCPGGELFHQIVRLTYFSEDLSRHVIRQVADSIEYLHETSGVVHRDIKPENLLFYPIEHVPSKTPKPRQAGDEDKEDEGEFIPGVGSGGIGKIKLADFGLSKVIWDSQTMTPCGTVGYTAPEIVKDERYSKSVDMWAMGCVLYTLLCGFPPFYDESIQVLTEKVARGQYTFLSPWWDDISKSAQDLISHLLTVDPEKRYTIQEFLAHPWIKGTDEETTAAADAPPLATPLTRDPEKGQGLASASAEHGPYQPASARFLDQPSVASERRMDFRSPGAFNLREVFDVGYAVHRQEEEGKRRANVRQANRGGTAGFQSALGALNEGYDEEQEYSQDLGSQQPTKAGKNPGDMAGMEAKLRHTNLGAQSSAAQARQAHQKPKQGYGMHDATVASAAKSSIRKPQQPFELTLNGATLLEKRGRRNQPVA